MFVKFGDVLAFPTDSYVVPFGLGPLFRILMELIFVLKLASKPMFHFDFAVCENKNIQDSPI